MIKITIDDVVEIFVFVNVVYLVSVEISTSKTCIMILEMLLWNLLIDEMYSIHLKFESTKMKISKKTLKTNRHVLPSMIFLYYDLLTIDV